MASRAVTSRAVRQRKLSTKVNLHIFRDGEIDLLPETEDSRYKVDTGVEKAEEIEHHLQKIIGNTQATVQAQKELIPTRGVQPVLDDDKQNDEQYIKFYPARFQQPATYIRFSSTVEDCTGTPYCMNDDDAGFLEALNKKSGKKKDAERCDEDQFEEAMSFFEQTAAIKQPYASVGESEPLSYDEMMASLNDSLEEVPKRFLKDIYDHWRFQRVKGNNQPLMPTLKFERNAETDESDPYVCFRRREIRQVRKTRGRDAQVTEKLKRLRVELEQSRQLLFFVKQREIGRRDQLAADRSVFEHRAKFKEIKRHLGNKEGDEDLINQKPSPKPRPNIPPGLRLQPGVPIPGHRPTRTDSLAIRASDSDYVQLEDIRARQAESIKSFVKDNMVKHTGWNQGWADATWRPITPPLDSPDDDSDPDPLGTELSREGGRRGWRAIDTSFSAVVSAPPGAPLPTPPASIASPLGDDDIAMGGVGDADKNGPPARNTRSRVPSVGENALTVRFAGVENALASPEPVRPLCRQRRGRGGRLMIDRRAPKRSHIQAFPEPSALNLSHPALSFHPYNLRKHGPHGGGDDGASDSGIDMSDPLSSTIFELRALDRFAYDNDDDSEEDEDHRTKIYYTDPHENMNIRYRMMWSRNADDQRAQQLHQQQQQQQQQMAAQRNARLPPPGAVGQQQPIKSGS